MSLLTRYGVASPGGGGGLIVPNGAALMALGDSGMADGTSVFVLSLRAYAALAKDGTADADNITVWDTASGTGKWFRRLGVDEYWKKRPVWVIDPVGGDDENIGVYASPLKTWAELSRRLTAWTGVFVTEVDTEVFIINDVPPTDPIIGFFRGGGGKDREYGTIGRFVITGQKTVQFQGVISAKDDLSVAAPGVTNKATSTWLVASEINHLIFDASNQRYAWIHGDLGGGQAELTPWCNINEVDGDFGTTTGNTTVGASVDTYSLPSVFGQCYIMGESGLQGEWWAPVLVQGLTFDATNPEQTGYGSIFGGVLTIFQNCRFLGENRFSGGTMYLNNCYYNGVTPFVVAPACKMQIGAGLLRAATQSPANTGAAVLDIRNNPILTYTLAINRMGYVRAANLFFRIPGTQAGFIVTDGGTLRVPNSGTICGDTSGNAAMLAAGGRLLSFNDTVSKWLLLCASPAFAFTGGGACRAFDESTGTFTNARLLTPANIDAAVAAGGFGGGVLDQHSGCFIGNSTF